MLPVYFRSIMNWIKSAAVMEPLSLSFLKHSSVIYRRTIFISIGEFIFYAEVQEYFWLFKSWSVFYHRNKGVSHHWSGFPESDIYVIYSGMDSVHHLNICVFCLGIFFSILKLIYIYKILKCSTASKKALFSLPK